MRMTIRCCCLAGMATALLVMSPALFGEESNLAASAYGDGVNAYFSGNSAEAESLLAEAIQNTPHDPRPYYFRGLSLLRLGRAAEARREMAAGAAFEARASGRYPVGESLERVQGRDRLLLEEFRRQARAENSSLQTQRRRARYQQNAGGDAEVLRQQVAVPLEDLIQPSKLPRWTRSSEAVVSPQETATAQELMDRGAADTAAAGTATAAAAANTPDDPFADDPESAAINEAEVADPFAVEATGGRASDVEASPGGGKIPPEKIWGIMGRVLRRAAPVPPLEGLRDNVPFVPGGGTSAGSFDAIERSDPFDDTSDQPDTQSDRDGGLESSPSEPSEDDPFEGF